MSQQQEKLGLIQEYLGDKERMEDGKLIVDDSEFPSTEEYNLFHVHRILNVLNVQRSQRAKLERLPRLTRKQKRLMISQHLSSTSTRKTVWSTNGQVKA